ncbi:MAG: 30S ribosomal protein S17 [Dehalococcoidia bacterium]|nr:30S ribosomal protein S17 [Dehalococcoidia bacterium]
MARFMRKARVGAVVRTNQDKTAIVEMVWKQRHRLYRKQMRRVARFYVHDEENQCRLGDTVRIEETRRISKNKHWRLIAILERKEVADVRPIDLETDVGQEITQPRILAAETRAAAAEAEPQDVLEEAVVEEPEAEEAVEEEFEADEEAVEEELEADEEAVEEEPDKEEREAEGEPEEVEEEAGPEEEPAKEAPETEEPDEQEEEE